MSLKGHHLTELKLLNTIKVRAKLGNITFLEQCCKQKIVVKERIFTELRQLKTHLFSNLIDRL